MKNKTKISIEEQKIVRLLKAKDKQAINLLYKHYSISLYGVILAIVHQEDVAQDVLQEAFVKIWHNGTTYDDSKGRLFTWLVNICRNTAIDKVRSKGYKQQQKIQDGRNLVDIIGSDNLDIDSIGLKELTETLTPKYKEVIDLIYFQGYSHQQVAKEKSLTLGVVKSRLKGAIKKLRIIFNIE